MKKPTRIVALDLRYSHPGERSHTTDIYYVKLANQLLSDFAEADIDLADRTPASCSAICGARIIRHRNT